jgi:NtrC-family two-component system sensor histidine kinase KinB
MGGAMSIIRQMRNTLQGWLPRLFLRGRANYRQILQDYAQILTTQVDLSRLLLTMAGQVEEVLHPSGLAIVLVDKEDALGVVLSHGSLASIPQWQEGTSFDSQHIVPAQLTNRRSPLYLPKHIRVMPERQQQQWIQIQESGVHVLAPVHSRGNLVGWLALGPTLSGRPYTQQDLDFLSALADQSSVAIESACLYGEMQQRATELAMIAMVSSAISSSLDVGQVLLTIVESVIQVVNCDKSAIFELSEEGTELNLRMGRGLSQLYVQHSKHLAVADDNRAWALSRREPFIVPDIRMEPRLANLVELAEQEGFRAVIDIPLIGREGPLGILSAYFQRVHSPSTTELEILTTFANHAAIAIENARLYTAVTRERDRARRLYEQTDAALARRVKELTTISEISRQLTSTLDMQQVLDLVLEQGMQATDADRGIIALCEPEQHKMWPMAQVNYPREFKRYRKEPWPLNLGITGRVARTGIMALVPDVRQDPDYVQMIDSTRSQLSVPISHDQAVLGVISLESDRRAAFTEEHVRFTRLLAEHAAIGIHNARLFQQVVEGRDRLQAILNSTQDIVIVFNLAGKVILTNPRVRELFGASTEQWLQSTDLLEDIRQPASPLFQCSDLDPEKLVGMLDQAQAEPDQPLDISFTFAVGDRRRFLEGAASSVLSKGGEPLGWVLVLRDATRQQELEQFREDLTSMMIHNLQGPLAALISSLDTLLEDDDTPPRVASELLRIAAGSGRKLYSRIESVLWIRRLEDQQVPLDLKTYPLSNILKPVVTEYRPMAAASDISLEMSLAEDLPPVEIDDEIVGRVFSNLLDNALKYTPRGGRIEVQARLEPGADSKRVLCAVADTGVGIGEELRKVLFDKFRQAGEPLHGRRKGMGIGLHYCKLAVEAHGGRIWVESRKGRGSTFYFTLPAVTDE